MDNLFCNGSTEDTFILPILGGVDNGLSVSWHSASSPSRLTIFVTVRGGYIYDDKRFGLPILHIIISLAQHQLKEVR
jgi:hypothetical protein